MDHDVIVEEPIYRTPKAHELRTVAPARVVAAEPRRVAPLTFETKLPWVLRAAHWFFIVNMVAQVFYIAWQVFVVLQPPGTIGPVFGAARDLAPEIMAARRAYAAEGWIAFVGLAVYVGVTEVLPRRLPR